jgi:hypothetical protein
MKNRAKYTFQIARAFPLGVSVFKAFNKQQAWCDNNFHQEHIVPADNWLDLGIEWDAVDAETVQATWPHLSISMAVDGLEIRHPKRVSKGPYKAVLECPAETHTGYAMANSLYLQPLPVGDHQILWTLCIKAEISDGWNTYPQGLVIHACSLLHVV